MQKIGDHGNNTCKENYKSPIALFLSGCLPCSALVQNKVRINNMTSLVSPIPELTAMNVVSDPLRVLITCEE
ncbi:MAG: hypothetical protein SH856_13670 [Flavobacteriales bacterium]|nr:hypothetical protein [Flavobacteriales bacterium]